MREHLTSWVGFRQVLIDVPVAVPEDLDDVVELSARILSDGPFSDVDLDQLQAALVSVLEHGAALVEWARSRGLS